MITNHKNAYTVALCTLGCKVNQYESQAMSEDFEKLGFRVCCFDEQCDAYVINTCTVTAESDRKSRQMIRKAVKNGCGKAVVAVTGCYSQIQKEKLLEIEGVTVVFGTSEKQRIASHVLQRIRGNNEALPCMVRPIERIRGFDKTSITRSERTRAIIKIVDGCNNSCSYCIIPKARGMVRSKKPEDVANEAKVLVEHGYKEIVLTGIETASYGKDLDGIDLCTLLKIVDKIDGLERIRLGSLEPTVITEEFVKTVCESSHIVHHFHLSLQSGSSRVLAGMKRKYNADMFMQNVALLREKLPDLTLTTDIIVGFPGESEQDFAQTVDMVEKCQFLYVHIFPFSRRKGTLADTLEDQIDENTKKKRAAELKKVMLNVRKKVLCSFDGTESSVLFEEKTEDGKYIGHTPNFIPVIFDSKEDLHGKILPVTLRYNEKNTEYMNCTAR